MGTINNTFLTTLLLTSICLGLFACSSGESTATQAPSIEAPATEEQPTEEAPATQVPPENVISISHGTLAKTHYFAGNNGASGYELFKSDGTLLGTELVKDINVGPNSSRPVILTHLADGRVIFTAHDGTQEGLYSSLGSQTSTMKLFDLSDVGLSEIGESPVVLGDKIVFSGKEIASGTEDPWVTDLSQAGTFRLADIRPGGGNSYINLNASVDLGGKLFFYADDLGLSVGAEPWVTDGTVAGTSILKNIRPGTANSHPTDFTVFNNKVYFVANDGVSGYQLWESDGSETGTQLVNNVKMALAGATPGTVNNILGVIESNLYLSADEALHGKELWKTDLSTSGTTLVKDINSTSAGADSHPINGIVMAGNIYFFAEDGVHERELWKTDGTDSGTQLLLDINTIGGISSNIENLFRVGAVLYFTAKNNTHDNELWVSDGSTANTHMVKDLYNTSSSRISFTLEMEGLSSAAPFVFSDGRVLFSCRSSSNALQPCVSDGTDAGTYEIQINAGGSGINSVG